jgi:hypothetical protein
MRQTLGILIFVAAMAHTAEAQQNTLQQPIVGTTGVATSVIVPDRGRILLGGVTSAQSSRARYGFGPSGSSVGLSRASRSLTAGVTIIDLREMDEMILNSVPDQPTSRWSRHAQAIAATSQRQPTPTASNSSILSAERATRFEQLARNAEAKNQLGVAKLHWQMAAKYGSPVARERLMVGKSD